MDESSLTPAPRLVLLEHRDAYKRLHPGVLGEARFFNDYERDACPLCRFGGVIGWGYGDNGARRWRCKPCGVTFTPMTGTIFEDHRLLVSAWVEFLLELPSFESLAGMTRQNRKSPTTLLYQLTKLPAVLGGKQNGIVPSGRGRADEMMPPLPRLRLGDGEGGEEGSSSPASRETRPETR